jgi:hypothetical protein
MAEMLEGLHGGFALKLVLPLRDRAKEEEEEAEDGAVLEVGFLPAALEPRGCTARLSTEARAAATAAAAMAFVSGTGRRRRKISLQKLWVLFPRLQEKLCVCVKIDLCLSILAFDLFFAIDSGLLIRVCQFWLLICFFCQFWVFDPCLSIPAVVFVNSGFLICVCRFWQFSLSILAFDLFFVGSGF